MFLFVKRDKLNDIVSENYPLALFENIGRRISFIDSGITYLLNTFVIYDKFCYFSAPLGSRYEWIETSVHEMTTVKTMIMILIMLMGIIRNGTIMKMMMMVVMTTMMVI